MPTDGRKYVLTRVGEGDYVFPSNDGRVLWRVTRYYEEGSLERDGRPVRGFFWRIAYFGGTLAQADEILKRSSDSFREWDRWREWDALLETRREATRIAVLARPGSVYA